MKSRYNEFRSSGLSWYIWQNPVLVHKMQQKEVIDEIALLFSLSGMTSVTHCSYK